MPTSYRRNELASEISIDPSTGPPADRAQTTRRAGASRHACCLLWRPFVGNTDGQIRTSIDPSRLGLVCCFEAAVESIDPTSTYGHEHQISPHSQKHRQRAHRLGRRASLLLNATSERHARTNDSRKREKSARLRSTTARAAGGFGYGVGTTNACQIRGLSIPFQRRDRSIDLTARPNNQKAPSTNRRSASWCAPVNRSCGKKSGSSPTQQPPKERSNRSAPRGWIRSKSGWASIERKGQRIRGKQNRKRCAVASRPVSDALVTDPRLGCGCPRR